MRKEIVLAIWILTMAFGGAARADDVNELKTQLAEQQKLLQQMQQRIEQLETSQKTQEQKVDEKITKAVESKQVTAVPDSLKWAEKVKLSGDFRYRHESIDSQKNSKDQFGTNRNRIRARLGIDVKVNDDWDLGFRLATGAADPASTNQSLENGFQKKDIWLDLAYFNWHPKSIERLNVYGGKMPLPFYRAGNNQLIWDDDVNPEGLAAKYVIPLGKADNLYINGGGFWLKADEGATGGAAVWGLQSYLKHDFENKDYLLGGLSLYASDNLKNKEGLYKSSGTGSSKFGNTMSGLGTTASPYIYEMNYNVLEGFAEYGFTVADLPASVYGSYVKNTAANTSEDSGWLIGTTLNKAKEPGSWEFGYNYRDVKKDAVVGVLTDSDFIGGGTDGKGHMLCGKYQLTKNIQATLTYFLAQKSDSDDTYRRLMADLIFKF
ncbi:MAG: putative porin [Sedimentisphaerales bacterium]